MRCNVAYSRTFGGWSRVINDDLMNRYVLICWLEVIAFIGISVAIVHFATHLSG